MATQMKLAVLDGESHGRPDSKRGKTSTKSRLFRHYLLMFDVYNYVDNREKDHKQILKINETNFVRRKNMKIS